MMPDSPRTAAMSDGRAEPDTVRPEPVRRALEMILNRVFRDSRARRSEPSAEDIPSATRTQGSHSRPLARDGSHLLKRVGPAK